MSSSMSLNEIRVEGWKALTERLGPAGAMRFMMEYNTGHGDYTEERRALFADVTIEDLFPGMNVHDHSEKPR